MEEAALERPLGASSLPVHTVTSDLPFTPIMPSGEEQTKIIRSDLVRTRQAAGLSQHPLASRLERPQSFVAKVEAGERRLDMIEFITLARAMNADPVKMLREATEAQDEISAGES